MGSVQSCFEVVLTIIFLPVILAIVIPWSIGEAIVKNFAKIMEVAGYAVLYTVALPICAAMLAGKVAGVLWNKFGQLRSDIRKVTLHAFFPRLIAPPA